MLVYLYGGEQIKSQSDLEAPPNGRPLPQTGSFRQNYRKNYILGKSIKVVQMPDKM